MYTSKNTNFVLVSIFILRKWQKLQMKSGKQNAGQSLRKTKRLNQAYLEKDRIQKKLQKQKDKTKPITEQEAHMAAERVRLRNCYIQKKKTEQCALALLLGESPYQTKQSTGKAIK